MWPVRYWILIGVALFLLSCAEANMSEPAETLQSAAAATRVPEEVVTIVVPDGRSEEGYWNGSEWPELPVYSLEHGISQAAHDHFVACGAGDEQIEELARLHMARAREIITLSSKMVVQAGQPESTPTFSRTMEIERIAPGAYVVTCERN